jgi:hypothetical protein
LVRSRLILRLVAAIVGALVILAVLAHVVVFALWQACVSTEAALACLLALIVCDAVALVRLLGIVGDAFLGEETESDVNA